MNIAKIRMGNYLSHGQKGIYHITRSHLSNNLLIACSKPIKLEAYWLELFGFEKIIKPEYNLGNCDYKKDVYTCLVRPMWRSGFINICNNHGFVKSLFYVHELQNLYFSLTDKELTIPKEVAKNGDILTAMIETNTTYKNDFPFRQKK